MVERAVPLLAWNRVQQSLVLFVVTLGIVVQVPSRDRNVDTVDGANLHASVIVVGLSAEVRFERVPAMSVALLELVEALLNRDFLL